MLDLHNLFPKFGKFLEGGHGGDTEDEKESVGVSHVELSHGSELLRTRRVHDL